MNFENPLRVLVISSNLGLLLTWLLGWFQPGGQQTHMVLGASFGLVYLFAQTCIIFYFVGTSVWMRDQAHAWVTRDRSVAQKVWSIYEAANKLKALTFPSATFGIMLGLFAFILGAARQVGAVASWVHPTLATLVLILAWISLWPLNRALKKNVAYLDEVSALTNPAAS